MIGSLIDAGEFYPGFVLYEVIGYGSYHTLQLHGNWDVCYEYIPSDMLLYSVIQR